MMSLPNLIVIRKRIRHRQQSSAKLLIVLNDELNKNNNLSRQLALIAKLMYSISWFILHTFTHFSHAHFILLWPMSISCSDKK